MTGRRWIGGLLLLAALLLLARLLAAPPQSELTGPVRVVDGDTLRVNGRRVRLRGLDAPEMAQTCRMAGAPYACGEEARRALVALAGRGLVTCVGSGEDRYGRLLAVCRALGQDLGAAMVARGQAVSYRGGYRAEEAEAKRLGLGLWAGSFQEPAQWRREHRPKEGAPGGAPGAARGAADLATDGEAGAD